MTEYDVNCIQSAARGGGEVQGGFVVEEPQLAQVPVARRASIDGYKEVISGQRKRVFTDMNASQIAVDSTSSKRR